MRHIPPKYSPICKHIIGELEASKTIPATEDKSTEDLSPIAEAAVARLSMPWQSILAQ